MDLSQSIDILKGFPEFLRPTGTVSDWLKRDKSGTSMLIYWASTGRWQKGDIMLKAYRNPYSLDWNNPEVIEAFELLGALLAAKSGRSAAIKRDLACNILCAALELKQRAGITGNQSEAKRKLRQLKDNEYKKFVRTGEEISYNILGKIHPRLLAQNQECSVLKRLSHRCSRKHLFHEVPLACDTLKKMIAMANLHSCHMKRRLNPHFFRELTKIWASIPYSFQDYHYNSVLIESLESVLSELLTWVIHSLSGVLSSSHGGCTPLVLTQEYSRGLLPIIYPFQFLILLNWSLRRGQDNFKRRGYLERLAAEVPQFLENCLGNLYDFLLHFCLSPKGHTLPLVPLFAWTLSQLRHPPLVGGSYQKWILRPSDTPERDEAVKVLMVHLASSTIGNRSLYSRRYKVARESRWGHLHTNNL